MVRLLIHGLERLFLILSERGAFLVATLFFAGCGGSNEAPSLIRLVDRIGEVHVESAFDFAVPPTGEVVADERFLELDRDRSWIGGAEWLGRLVPALGEGASTAGVGHRFLDRESGRTLLLVGPAVLFFRLPVAPGGSLSAELLLDGPVAVSPVLLELDVPWQREWFEDGGRALDVLRSAVSRPLAMNDAIVPDGSQMYRATFRPRPSTRGLMLLVFCGAGQLAVERLTLTRRPTLAAWAARDESDHGDPHIRRLEIDDDHREAIPLATPASLEVELDLPAREPSFHAAVGAFHAEEEARIQVVVEARDVADPSRAARTEFQFATAVPCWREFRLDLASLAGHRVKVRVRLTSDGKTPVGVALAHPTIEGNPAAPPPPDVILISLDTVRRDRMSVYGAIRETTPHLSRLAAEAVVFDQAISPSSWTLPTHATVFTGQWPERHGVITTQRRLATEEVPVLAEVFRERGYRTVAVTAGGLVHPDFGFARGFERYSTEEVVAFAERDGAFVLDEAHPRRRELLELLSRPRKHPLFLFLHTYTAHNYVAAEESLAALGSRREALDVVPPGFRAKGSEAVMDEAKARGEELRLLEQVALLYDATVRDADRLVGDVLTALERGGRADDAWLIVFSDHGEELYEHGRVGHGLDLHEELIRVPLILRAPGLAPRRIKELVNLVDLAPTLYDWFAIDPGANLDGRSLLPRLHGRGAEVRLTLSQVQRLSTLRGSQWKLVEGVDAEKEEVLDLFDVLHDPGEELNRAAVEPAVLDKMRKALSSLRRYLADSHRRFEEGKLSPEREAELRALGYLGGD